MAIEITKVTARSQRTIVAQSGAREAYINKGQHIVITVAGNVKNREEYYRVSLPWEAIAQAISYLPVMYVSRLGEGHEALQRLNEALATIGKVLTPAAPPPES